MPVTCSERTGRHGRARRLDPLQAAAAVITVLPVWIAALRSGLDRTPPSGDAALTVLRATDVFSAHPPLVGMLAAGASGAGHDVHFPGPWQLYVLAVPTQLFGIVWGPVVAMGALNTLWLALACWLLCRRLDRVQSLIGIGFLALFCWSIGSGLLITPVPMDMVMIPFVAFLIAVWCVATGDLVGVPILALLANFLWSSHLVLVLLVPVIGLCALIGLGLWLRQQRAERSDPMLGRKVRRSFITAGAITVVMWLPPLIQQFTATTGNLRLLLASSGDGRESVGSWTSAAHIVITAIARPPFWFRGTVDAPSYTRAPIGPDVIGLVTLFDLVAAIAVSAGVVVLAVVAHRRRDRIGLWALIVAAVAAMASLPNTYLAPTTVGFPVIYLRSLQGVAMFVWFAITLNVVRLARDRIPALASGVLLAAIAVVTALNVPASASGYGADRRAAHLVSDMTATVADRLDTPVKLQPGWDLFSQSYFAGLALGLEDRGVPFCVAKEMVRQIGRACGDRALPIISIVAIVGEVPALEHVVWRGRKLTGAEQVELARLDDRWRRWLASRDRLELTGSAAAMVARFAMPDTLDQLGELLAPRDGDLRGVQDAHLFTVLVEYSILQHDGSGVSPFVGSPLRGRDLVRWSRLVNDDQTVVVREQPAP